MEESASWIGRLPWPNRGDVGFCSEQIMAWHEQDNKPHYLFKLRLTKNLKRAIARLKEEDWQGCHNFGILQTAELKLQLSGSPTQSRGRTTSDGPYWRGGRW